MTKPLPLIVIVVAGDPGATEFGEREVIDTPLLDPLPGPVVPAKSAEKVLGGELLSVTWRVYEYGPLRVVYTPITALTPLGVNVKPVGIDPELTTHVNGAVPPFTLQLAE